MTKLNQFCRHIRTGWGNLWYIYYKLYSMRDYCRTIVEPQLITYSMVGLINFTIFDSLILF